MDNDKVISVQNNLIETCRDGQNGFKEAAENVKDSRLKEFFYEVSQERARFVGELQQLVRDLGGDPENTGSTAAALHRAWIDIKGKLTGMDDQAILNECERGEDSAVGAYRDALKDDLPANMRSVIERQYQSVLEVHDRIKALRDSRAAISGNR
ncbi:MAG TPA: PA2169 family four-helix-bundle protein [Blastocatellia bacterium]|nr:PA2169 family four-helix-bundle protein [Blastocatellia bacterium]